MTPRLGFFPLEEYQDRLRRVRADMEARRLDGCLVSAPENVYYLTGLDHQGYFAYQALLVPRGGDPVLITRSMEQATVRDQVPWVRHAGYSDGAEPLPKPRDRDEDLVLAIHDRAGGTVGLRPWEMSLGVSVRGPLADTGQLPIDATVSALEDAGLAAGRLGIEARSSFLSVHVARGIARALPRAEWLDVSGLVDDCRLVQSPRELECTRKAAAISDSMMLAAIAAAGPGVHEHEVMAAIYAALFRRGGTYPGFVPLVRSTRTLQHEHGTWGEGRLRSGDLLFLEMAGCVRRYHAPIGRLVFIGRAPKHASSKQRVCHEAMQAAMGAIAPGVKAGAVYEAWQRVLDASGLPHYRRHHCGYAVGIGFPPSWSGSGPPRGLRAGSDLELRVGMVFHLMSWLLRTGRGDSFMSDTVIVGERGCELLTRASREVLVR